MVPQVLRLLDVKLATGLGRTSIYRGAAAGTFPKPIKIGVRSSGWLKAEVDQWLADRIAASRHGGACEWLRLKQRGHACWRRS